jgi:hypothetical protein
MCPAKLLHQPNGLSEPTSKTFDISDLLKTA